MRTLALPTKTIALLVQTIALLTQSSLDTTHRDTVLKPIKQLSLKTKIRHSYRQIAHIWTKLYYNGTGTYGQMKIDKKLLKRTTLL